MESNVTKNIHIRLSCDSAITLLGIYLQGWKPAHFEDIYIPIFTVELFTISELWITSSGLQIDLCGWICMCEYNQTVEYCCATENNGICRKTDGIGDHRVSQRKQMTRWRSHKSRRRKEPEGEGRKSNAMSNIKAHCVKLSRVSVIVYSI